jgi:hypothetical protein
MNQKCPPVPKDRNHGHQNRQNRDPQRDTPKGLATFPRFLHLIRKFLDFIGFHSGMILARRFGGGFSTGILDYQQRIDCTEMYSLILSTQS